MSKSSIPYLGTVPLYKTLRIYLRCAEGMPGSFDDSQKLISRVIGEFIQEGFIVTIADDIHVYVNTIP